MQRGYVDIGFMGGAQIDQYGNLNSSLIKARRDGLTFGCQVAAAVTT